MGHQGTIFSVTSMSSAFGLWTFELKTFFEAHKLLFLKLFHFSYHIESPEGFAHPFFSQNDKRGVEKVYTENV